LPPSRKVKMSVCQSWFGVARSKERGWGGIPLGFGARLLEELLLVEGAAHRLPAHGEEQDAPEELADLLDPEVGVAPLQRDGLRLDRGRHLRLPVPRLPRRPLQARRALRAIGPNPLPQCAQANPEVPGDLRDGEAFLHTELDRFAPELHGVDVWVRCSPPSLPLGSLLLPLNLAVPVHGFHSFRSCSDLLPSECHPFSSPVFAHDLVVSPPIRFKEKAALSRARSITVGSHSMRGG